MVFWRSRPFERGRCRLDPVIRRAVPSRSGDPAGGEKNNLTNWWSCFHVPSRSGDPAGGEGIGLYRFVSFSSLFSVHFQPFLCIPMQPIPSPLLACIPCI
jgi:hypothetical protein